MTEDEFVALYAERSGLSVKDLLVLRRPAPCACESAICLGWKMTTEKFDLPHTPGCTNDTHNPALTWCTNEQLTPWSV